MDLGGHKLRASRFVHKEPGVKVRDFKAAMQENIKYAHHGLRVLRLEQLPALGAETNDPPGDIGCMRWDQSHAFNTVRRTDNHVAIQPALI